jgi:hypothetical protein
MNNLVLSAVLFCTTLAHANTHEATQSHSQLEGWAVSFSTGIIERQLLPNGHVLHDGPLGKLSFDVEMHEWGLYAHILTQRGLGHDNTQEVDGFLGITNTFGDHYRYDIGIMHDHNTNDQLNNFWRLHIRVGLDTGEAERNFRINPFISFMSFIAHDHSEHMSSGHVASIGIEDKWTVNDRLSVSIPASVAYDTGIAHSEPGVVVAAGVNIRYALNDKLSVEAGYQAYLRGDGELNASSSLMVSYRF